MFQKNSDKREVAGLQEAKRILEAALQAAPAAQAAFNLVLCAFATGEAAATRQAFSILVQVRSFFKGW